MTDLPPPFRRATSNDAEAIAELVNIAGDGLPEYLWAKLAKSGQSGMDVGRERARAGAGGFAFEGTVVREVDGRVAACLISYPQAGAPELDDEVVPVLRPTIELQQLVPNTWYINSIATLPQFRRRGLATELLTLAERFAREAKCESVSLIMSDANAAARAAYEKNGFAKRATRPIIKENWNHDGETWVLMVQASNRCVGLDPRGGMVHACVSLGMPPVTPRRS